MWKEISERTHRWCSCNECCKEEQESTVIEKIYINKEKVFPNMNGNIDIRIVNFNYKNHQYLYFLSYCTNEDSCVIHDPDCPCHQK